MHERGAKVVAVSDVSGAVYDERGLDPRHLKSFAEETGSVVGYPRADSLTNEELLELKVDVLIPAALEGQITKENADKINAPRNRRRGERADYAGSRPHSGGQGRPDHSGYSVQCRRRGGQLL